MTKMPSTSPVFLLQGLPHEAVASYRLSGYLGVGLPPFEHKMRDIII